MTNHSLLTELYITLDKKIMCIRVNLANMTVIFFMSPG